jgi:hypothetical protein
MQLVFDHPEPPPFADLLYFSTAYEHIQDYQKPVIVRAQKGKTTLFWIKYEQRNHSAYSLPKSPFGGIWMHPAATREDFNSFVLIFLEYLMGQNIDRLALVQAPTLYNQAVPDFWLEEAGFKKTFTDQNQHIDLTSLFRYHDMQYRRLKKLEKLPNVEFTELHGAEMDQLYSFLAHARRQQGLQINLDADTFAKLQGDLPGSYRGFAVQLDKKTIAGLFLGYVTDEIAYYFLPGSDKAYHHFSPMVLLIDRLLAILRREKIKTLDMGVSSIEGKLQEGLFSFKERMGAQTTTKSTFTLDIG